MGEVVSTGYPCVSARITSPYEAPNVQWVSGFVYEFSQAGYDYLLDEMEQDLIDMRQRRDKLFAEPAQVAVTTYELVEIPAA